MNNKEIVGINLAKIAKEYGYNNVCDYCYCFDSNLQSYYTNYDPDYFINEILAEQHYAAPTRENLNKWLREKNIFITIEVDQTLEPKFCYHIAKFSGNDLSGWEWKNFDPSGTALFYKYEQALEEALEEGLKLI
jgi:hypothetical protein